MSDEFDFIDGDLPVGKQYRSDPVVTRFATALRERPGQWAVYPAVRAPSTLAQTASHINQGSDKAPKPLRKGFEAHMSGGVVYVRFVGEPDG